MTDRHCATCTCAGAVHITRAMWRYQREVGVSEETIRRWIGEGYTDADFQRALDTFDRDALEAR